MNTPPPIHPPASREDELFAAAIVLPPEERAAHLEAACGDDLALLARVKALLAGHESAGFMAGGGAAASPEMEAVFARLKPEEVGEMIGNYKLREEIGEGGFGTVWVADQEQPVRRRVALKIIKMGMDTKDVIARFEQERQALAMMDHPNIAKVLDAGSTQHGRPFFVMELVRGMPITQYCDEAGLGTRERLALFGDVCSAINHAHQKSVIHRDIKPSNVLVTLHGDKAVVKVIDFGIAKATQGRLTDHTVYTQFQQMVGTPAYMSPEQAGMSGLDVDTRSDIYALGVLLYELLIGKPPFDGKSLVEAGYEEMRRIIREVEPEKPSSRLSTIVGEERTLLAKSHRIEPEKLGKLVEPDLDWIVMKAIDKDRARRYETANAFAQDIVRFLADEPVTATPPSAGYQFRKFARRNKAALRVAAVIAAVLVVATAVSTWQAIRATRAEELARHRLAEVATERDQKDQAQNDTQQISKLLSEVFKNADPRRDGHSITVTELLGKSAKKLETDLVSQPARRASLQETLAQTYRALDLTRDAIPLQEKALEYYVANAGREDPATVRAMDHLWISYSAVGRWDDARRMAEEVLAIRRKVFGPDDPHTISALHNLAFVFYESGAHRDEAIKIQEAVVALRRKVNGSKDPNTLRAIDDLAYFMIGVRQPEGALKMQEEALASFRDELGPENPSTIEAMNLLAISFVRAGREKDALELREKVLALSRKVNGPEDPTTLLAMSNLALSYTNAGRVAEAIRIREELVTLSRRVNGPEDPTTLDAIRNLALLCSNSGRIDEAIALEEEFLALNRQAHGPEHLRTLSAMSGLARLYFNASRTDAAIKLQEEALRLWRKLNGLENIDTARAMNDLARSYWKAGRHDEAIKLKEDVLALYRKVSGPEKPDTLIAMRGLIDSYLESG
ncbi:MAG: serine/threonine-protein kinase, partial [Chthoniobacteraceae bacterium]